MKLDQSHLNITVVDQGSELFIKLKAFFENNLNRMRHENDKVASIDDTQFLRGQIDMIKQIMTLMHPSRPMAPTKSGAYPPREQFDP